MTTDQYLIIGEGTFFILLAFSKCPWWRWIYTMGEFILCLTPIAIIIELAQTNYVNAIVEAYTGLALAFFLWKNRNKRNKTRATKLIGAKARAIRDKLVSAMPKAKPIAFPSPA